MVKTLSWNQTMANKFRKSFAILLYLIRQKTVGFYWNPSTYFIEFVISLQRLNPPSLAFANHSPFANALYRTQRIRQLPFRFSEWQGTAFAYHSPFAIRFSEMTNGECKTTLYPFQLICATVKGNLERPLEVSCLPAQEVEAALEARLISTAVGPGASAVTSQSTASSRSQCFKNLFLSVHTRKLTEREREQVG